MTAPRRPASPRRNLPQRLDRASLGGRYLCRATPSWRLDPYQLRRPDADYIERVETYPQCGIAPLIGE